MPKPINYDSDYDKSLIVKMGDTELIPSIQVEEHIKHISTNLTEYINQINCYDFFKLLKKILRLVYTNTSTGISSLLNSDELEVFPYLYIESVTIDSDGDICYHLPTMPEKVGSMVTTCINLTYLVNLYIKHNYYTDKTKDGEKLNTLLDKLYSLSNSLCTPIVKDKIVDFSHIELHILYSLNNLRPK